MRYRVLQWLLTLCCPVLPVDDPDALAADLDAASVPAHRAPIAEPPPAGEQLV